MKVFFNIVKLSLCLICLLFITPSFGQKISECLKLTIKLKDSVGMDEEDVYGHFSIQNICGDTIQIIDSTFNPRTDILWVKVKKGIVVGDTNSLRKIVMKSDINHMGILWRKNIFPPKKPIEFKRSICLVGFIYKKGNYRVKCAYRVSQANMPDEYIESDWHDIYFRYDYREMFPTSN